MRGPVESHPGNGIEWSGVQAVWTLESADDGCSRVTAYARAPLRPIQCLFTQLPSVAKIPSSCDSTVMGAPLLEGPIYKPQFDAKPPSFRSR